MSKFVEQQTKIKSITQEEAVAKLVNVVELETETNQKIEELKVDALKEPKISRSPMQKTDKTSAKFVLNPVVKSALGMDREERQEIERQVQMRLAVLAEEGRKKGYKEGHAQGLEEGKKQAFEKFRVESEDVRKRLEDFLDSCNMAKWRIFEENERFLIELIFQIAKKVLLTDLKKDSEYLVRLTKELIEKVNARDHISIRIHPQEAARIEYLDKELHQKLPELKNIQIETSDRIPEGGCEVETLWSHITAHLEEQLVEIHKTLTTDQATG